MFLGVPFDELFKKLCEQGIFRLLQSPVRQDAMDQLDPLQ
jgi:hypothetical protein